MNETLTFLFVFCKFLFVFLMQVFFFAVGLGSVKQLNDENTQINNSLYFFTP